MKYKFTLLYLTFILLSLIYMNSCGSWWVAGDQNNDKMVKERESYRFVFYNVENLFDTLDDPEKHDAEFLPTGSKQWDGYKYYDKLQKISKVLMALGEWSSPDIIGLCEIENRGVLNDLLKFTPLINDDYGIIHKESPDFRGIDVALLYNPERFKPLYYQFFEVEFPFDQKITTREILYAKGILGGMDTLHIFINHWPSRRGGKEASEPKRMYVAQKLRARVDSLLSLNPKALILISGDFNDEPVDNSLIHGLKASGDSLSNSDLYNLMYPLKKAGEGSYRYRNNWNTLDQIIVSKAFFEEGSKLYTYFNQGHIYRKDWLLEESKKYPGYKPKRSFIGPIYHRGYSDHLPVYLDIFSRL